jgi:exodeoxyribonuclease VII large subunit
MEDFPVILSVSEVTSAIKAQIEPTFRHIWVRGEITNYRLQSSGHHYFSLTEGGAQLSAVLFRNAAPTLAQPLKVGDTVIAEGEISVYAPRGSYQLIVRRLTHVGLGEALIKLQALKKKLQALGWFSPERKRPLPVEIRTIGLVTSPSGAVLHDIINILTRRIGGFHLIVNPVRVQGEGAAQEIARAITEFNAYVPVDVMIVCRGGGSAEDLSAFNEEVVASACVQSRIPIISAIGHETDLSITDLVADVRAPTPSAAAELVSHVRFERRQQLSTFADTAQRLVCNRLRAARSALLVYEKRLGQSGPQRRLEEHAMRLDDVDNALFEAMRRVFSSRKQLLAQVTKRLRLLAPTVRLAEQRTRLSLLEKELLRSVTTTIAMRQRSLDHMTCLIDERMKRHLGAALQRLRVRDWEKDLSFSITLRLQKLQQRLGSLISNLQALNPQRTLERGYAIVFRGNSTQVVRSVHTVQPEEPVSIMVADGRLGAIITRGMV